MACVVFVFCAAMTIASPGQTLTTAYSFCSQPNCADGALPHAGLVQGTDGNLYGTTSQGAAFDGTIFKITPQGALTTLHTFGGADGADALAELLQGDDGNLYGTTFNGGANDDPSCVFGGFVGCGTVFKVTPEGSLNTLYNFCSQQNCFDGAEPPSALVQGTDGNLYGTSGGQAGGTFFKITPAGTLTTLYYFCSQPNCADGEYPLTLVQSTDGNFYGTTYAGGTSSNCCGTVFKITPQGTLTTLHSFDNAGGCYPEAGLVQGTDGNFYGTTSGGGLSGYCGSPVPAGGTVFKITPAGILTTLYNFCSRTNCTDGDLPYGALVQATDGNFYGTTNGGGSYGNCGGIACGTVFEITAAGTLTTLYNFCSQPNCADGILPYGKLMQAADGNFYGTTYEGGTNGAGTVFRLIPLGSSTTAVTSSPNPSTFGEPVTITATVSPSGPPAPTGTVGFTSNGTAISGCTAVTLSAGEAVCMTTGLAVGTDAIVATYSGDSNYAGSSGTLSQLVNPIPSPLQFVAVTPCRLVDTRPDRGGSGPIQGGTFQNFPIPQEGGCNIPTTAAAYSLNVSVVPQGTLSYLTIWPTGEGRPLVATLNSIDGRIKANAAIVPAGTSGAVSIYVTNTTNVILDINGYFAPASGSTLAFYPLTPCRVADTRYSSYPPGLGPPFLTGGQERAFPILNASTCNIPASGVVAYSLNFSVVPHGSLFYMTVWPTGETRPTVSTLNDISGRIIPNAAIVVAGTSGEVSVYPTNDTDLVIDINGYFAPAGTGGLSLYAVAPCRVIDTRHVGSGQPFSGTLTPPVDVTGSFCGPPATAQAYVFNATVVPVGALGYLTLWPDGAERPTVSTLNALDGSITNNMAIVPTTNGKVDAYASGLTQLILDISSYFAP
jgi:uncharacterized repeat protein (TIGR03803 family)